MPPEMTLMSTFLGFITKDGHVFSLIMGWQAMCTIVLLTV